MAAATMRDTTCDMRYINPNPGPEGGLVLGENVSKEMYKKGRHLMTDERMCLFEDARTAPEGLEGFGLEKNGFMKISPPGLPDGVNWRDYLAVRDHYYPLLVECAKKHVPGSQWGCVFQHLVRDENPANVGISYARFAHADAGPGSPPKWREMLVNKYGFSQSEVDNVDIMMVNIWHPFDRPAYKDPLCLLDVSTMDFSRELQKIQYVFPPEMKFTPQALKGFSNFADVSSGRPESLLVGPSYAPGHRWIFCSDMRPDEGWLFKQYDEREVKAKACFHNSFSDPFHIAEPKETHGRRSGEFRILLTFPKGAAASKL